MIGSIFVITIVVGDFITIGVLGGQQIASVCTISSGLPAAPGGRGQCGSLGLDYLLMVAAMMRIVSRKEL